LLNIYEKSKSFKPKDPKALDKACDWCIKEFTTVDGKWGYLTIELRETWTFRYWNLMSLVAKHLNLTCPARQTNPNIA